MGNKQHDYLQNMEGAQQITLLNLNSDVAQKLLQNQLVVDQQQQLQQQYGMNQQQQLQQQYGLNQQMLQNQYGEQDSQVSQNSGRYLMNQYGEQDTQASQNSGSYLMNQYGQLQLLIWETDKVNEPLRFNWEYLKPSIYNFMNFLFIPSHNSANIFMRCLTLGSSFLNCYNLL